MIRHVVLVQALYGPDPMRHAISLAVNPDYMLSSLNEYSPVLCQLVHIVRADNRAEYLLRTLQIRYQTKKLHSFWYRLSPTDVAFIKSLTDQNFFEIAGFINRQAVPPPPPRPPVIPADELLDFVAQQIAITEQLLK